MSGQEQARKRAGGSNRGSLNPGTHKKKMRRGKRLSLSPDLLPTTGECTGNREIVELLLDMSSRLQAMEAYIAQQEEADREQAVMT